MAKPERGRAEDDLPMTAQAVTEGEGETGSDKSSLSPASSSSTLAVAQPDQHASLERLHKVLSEVYDPEKDPVSPSDTRYEDSGDFEPDKESWLQPRINIFRLICACLAFFNLGANDGATGALIPHLEEYYHISYAKISFIFFFAATGFVTSAFSLTFIDARLGMLNTLRIGISLQFLSYAVQSFAPPYPLLLICYFLGGFGQALQEAQYSGVIAGLKDTTVLLGMMHAAYGLGGTVSPNIATAVVTTWNLPWKHYFYFAGPCVLLSGILTQLSMSSYRQPTSSNSGSTSFRLLLSSRIAWLTSVFLLLYVGAEVTLGGWLVTYMLDDRHFDPAPAAHVASTFWLGIFLGRVLLAYPTAKFGEYKSLIIYIILCILVHIAFWLHRSAPVFLTLFYIGMIGFLLGPMFSTAISVAASATVPSLRVNIVGFCSAFGAAGAAVFPFLTGWAGGPTVMNAVYAALVAGMLFSWIGMPRNTVDEKDGKKYHALEMEAI